jgi:hypothetical protein
METYNPFFITRTVMHILPATHTLNLIGKDSSPITIPNNDGMSIR